MVKPQIPLTLDQVEMKILFCPDLFINEIVQNKWINLIYNGDSDDREKLRMIRKFYFSRYPQTDVEPYLQVAKKFEKKGSAKQQRLLFWEK
jgi:hypothetical protein